jgi:hypothetical protein
MRVFFLDLWLDLREKRLAPLAIILLAAVIAVPVVLAKPEKAVPPPPTATTAAAPTAPVVASLAKEQQVDSKLQTFSSRDPFEPTGHTATTTTSSTTTTTTTSGSSGTSTGTSTSGGSASTPTTTGGGGATTGSGPTTTGNSGTGTGNTTGETKTTLFTYTVDLRFGTGGNMQRFDGVQRLDLIPSQQDPKVVFLGVTTTGKTAVFLVDSNIGVDTPGGRCRPSADQCTFLYLRPDNDHDTAQLTDQDGTVYHLRLLGIHRVSVSSANGQTTTGNGNSNGSNGTNRSHAFTGRANDKSSADTTPAGETPPGEPDNRSTFQQFFADGAATH